MVEYTLSSLLTKMKTATKQAANVTVKQAKIARLRFDLMALHSERAKHLQNIGSHLFSSYKDNKKFSETVLFSELQTEIDSIKSLDKRIEAIEAQLQEQQLDNIEIKDITPQ